MRRSLILVGLASILLANKCERELVDVSLNITQTQSYCGGAEPSDDILSELRTPHKLSRTLYILNAENTCVDSFLTSNSGVQGYSLPTGKYSLRFTSKVFNSKTSELNNPSDCVKEWNSRELATFELAKDRIIGLNVHINCNPCYPPPP